MINNRRPYWNYANYRDYQNRINWRSYWNYAIERNCQNRINRRPYWNCANFRDYQNRINRRESNSNLSISINSINTIWPQSPFLGLLAKLYLINVSCVDLVNPFLRVLFSLFSDFMSVATLALGVWKVSVLSSSSESSTLDLF